MTSSDVLVFVCRNCVPVAGRLPKQWYQNGTHVCLQELPCSGKVDGRYVMHALEDGVVGLCIVTCPDGECRLAEGNRRADVRVQTAKRLLGEIGLEPDRLQLIRFAGNGNSDSSERLHLLIEHAVDRLLKNGRSPLLTLTEYRGFPIGSLGERV